MKLTGNKFRELLTNLNIVYHKHNFNLIFRDIENGMRNVIFLDTYQHQFEKPYSRGNRIQIESTVDNVFSGKEIDLVSNKSYKEYTINVKEDLSSGYEEYIFNTFESFNYLSNGEYVRNTMSLKNDKIEIVEKHGIKDDFGNYVVNNQYRITAQDENGIGFICVKDETDERAEYSEERFNKKTWIINNKTETYLEEQENGINYGIDIIENNALFKQVLEVLYPDLYDYYVNNYNIQKQKSLINR